MRGWRSRERVNQMRLRVCKAVEIQTVWRGYRERKKLVRLRQATIILQAHWRGRALRMRYRELKEVLRREREEEEEQRVKEAREREDVNDTTLLGMLHDSHRRNV